jgi:GntR family transcriptional regulator, arabinose operon transcriptional repressor
MQTTVKSKVNKPASVATVLANRVLSGVLFPGSKLPSQKELCDEFDISRTGIHYVFNILEDRGIITREPGRGVFVRATKQSKKLTSCGVLLPEWQVLEFNEYDNFGIEIFYGIEKTLRLNNVNCVFRRISVNELDSIPAIVGNMQVDGLIFARTFTDKQLRWVTKYNMPMVIAGRRSNIPEFSSVCPNIHDFYLNMFKRLEQEGCRKICIFNKRGFFIENDFSALAAECNHGMSSLKIELIDYLAEEGMKRNDEEEIYKEVRKIVKTGRLPDVFVGSSDWVALRILEELNCLGVKVPHETGVIGCLGMKTPDLNLPKISTFKLDTSELGAGAVKVLMKAIKKNFPIIERIPLEYQQGGSLII